MSALPPPEDNDPPPPVSLWRQTMAEQREVGIGGALWLVVIGRVLAPFVIAFSLYRNVSMLLEPGVWTALTSPGSRAYHPLWGGVLIYEVIGWGTFLLTSLLALWLLWRRHSAFPAMMIAYQAVFILFLWGDALLGGNIPAVRENAVFSSLIVAAVQATVMGAIWIPYFLVSERVRNTFVR